MVKFNIPQLDTKQAAEAGVVVGIKALDGVTPVCNADGKPLEIKVLGRDSRAYAAAMHEIQQARLNKMAQGGNATATFEESQKTTLELLVACTVGWANFLDANGDPVAFSRAAVAELYSQFPAVRDQVDACIGNRANFLGDSAKS
jgi:hypothetical protein